MKKILIIALFLMVLTACSRETIYVDNGIEKIKLKANVADTAEEIAAGLEFRESTNENEAMFFDFGQEAYYSFSMQGALYPVDLVFISKDFRIIEVFYAEPCEEEPCPQYKSSKAAQYVLQTRGGFTADNVIVPGNTVIRG